MEVPTARFVDGAGQSHGVPGPGPHLVPQARPGVARGEGEEEGAEEECWGDKQRVRQETEESLGPVTTTQHPASQLDTNIQTPLQSSPQWFYSGFSSVSTLAG